MDTGAQAVWAVPRERLPDGDSPCRSYTGQLPHVTALIGTRCQHDIQPPEDSINAFALSAP